MAGEDDDKDVNQPDTMGLSAEEIAAMNDDDEDEKQVVDDLADDDDEDDTEDDDSDEDGDEKDDKKVTDKSVSEKTEPVAEIVEETEAENEETKPDIKEFVANPYIERIENYNEKLAEIETKQTELDTRLEDGDIDLKEYTQQLRKLNEQETDLKMSKMIADNEEKQLIKAVTDKWDWFQEQFFTKPANKIYSENNMLYAAFNAKTMELAAIPANEGKSGAWFLEEADRQVRKLFVGKDDKDNVVDINKNGNRKPDLKNIPKTLGSLPAATNSEASENEFADIDNLEGMEYESALALMEAKDPAKAARYSRA